MASLVMGCCQPYPPVASPLKILFFFAQSVASFAHALGLSPVPFVLSSSSLVISSPSLTSFWNASHFSASISGNGHSFLLTS